MRTRTQESKSVAIGKKEIKQPPITFFTKTKQEEPKIINLAVHLEKLTAQLNDGRELSIPIDWFAKWGVKGVNAEKLRNYEIKRGVNIYFPDIDEVLGIETSRGEIEFWLEPTDTKSEDEIKIKEIKGRVSENEQNETEKIVKKNKDLFLAEWKKRKVQKE